MDIKEIESLAKQIRIDVLNMTHDAKSSHVGSCLSCADILAVLYGGVMKVDPQNPDWMERDRFILSKGHACAALYSVLANRGFFDKSQLKDFYKNGSYFTGHANWNVYGVEVSTGALGDGLSIGCGMALANPKSKVYVLMGDGDCNEGMTWEAAMFAAQHKLDNLVAIVDYNNLQALGKVEDISGLRYLYHKWESFGWNTFQVDGHDIDKMKTILPPNPFMRWRPSCIIADTVKGKGVSFLKNRVESHYKCLNDAELKLALEELK